MYLSMPGAVEKEQRVVGSPQEAGRDVTPRPGVQVQRRRLRRRVDVPPPRLVVIVN